MAEKDRKGKAEEHEEKGERTAEKESERSEREHAAEEESEGEEETAEGSDEDEEEGEGEADDGDGGEEGDEEERHGKAASHEDTDDDESDEEGGAAARRVADALGVGEGNEAAGEKPAEEQAAPQNRAARRAEAAQRRKKRRAAVTARSTEGGDEDEALPRDKNARAKELLKRRREQAEAGPRAIQLLPGEMVDDALARGSSAITKWLRQNFSLLQWVVLGAAAVGGGYLFYTSRAEKTEAGATDALIAGIDADRGQVMAEDKRTDDEKEVSTLKVFKTADERADTALASYKKVVAEHPGTGAAILARLGEAGDYLDKKDYDHAMEGFSAVASSTLAGADADVKARALEGLGFAKEAKGDLDGAIAAFKELEGVSKELGLYHQGRIWLAKGDKDKAKDALKQVHDKLEQPTGEGRGYLQQMTDEMLRRIDPSLVPSKPPVVGGPKGNAQSPEEMEKLRRMLQDAMMKKGPQGDQH